MRALVAGGNVAASACDNVVERVGAERQAARCDAPVVSMEQLIYDCRLFNSALADGGALQLRKWMIDSDAGWIRRRTF